LTKPKVERTELQPDDAARKRKPAPPAASRPVRSDSEPPDLSLAPASPFEEDAEDVQFGFFRQFVRDIKEVNGWWRTGGVGRVLNQFKLAFFKNANRNIIDPVVLALFYLVLLATTFSAAFNILREIYLAFKVHTEASVLKISEHIFLNLLPIFIVFGFLNYYTRSARNALLKTNQKFEDDERSAKPMNFSKVLFVSSMISYVVIKVIEALSLEEDPARHVNIPVLISYGGLLVILMVYFIILNRKDH